MTRFGNTLVLFLLPALWCPDRVVAVETAPRIADREIIERLTKLEAGQTHLAAAIEANTAAINQLRADIQTQGHQLRQDMNAQFDRLAQLMLGILGAFTALVVLTIGFALWDRRTMIRPFEEGIIYLLTHRLLSVGVRGI